MNVEEDLRAKQKLLWRIQIELDYALICKHCHRKVMDPDKSNPQQVFTKSRCPHCFKSKDQRKADQHTPDYEQLNNNWRFIGC